MEKMRMETENLVDENIKKLMELFPSVVTEVVKDGKVERAVDFDALKQELSDVVVEGNEERYQFNWPDKKKARLLANTPVRATLRPCKEESVDFDTTQNLYIEGDNLDVLKLLSETYLGKIKFIYIDPPYNTGNDFVYSDDFSMSVEEYSQIGGDYDEQGNRLVQNTSSNGRFHTDWLNMIYPRLRVSRDLLREDGVIFISIDENEIENLKKVCNEIFGEANFVNVFSVKRGKKSLNSQFLHIKTLNIGFEYLVVYAKSNAFSYLNPFEEASDKQKQGSWAGLYNGAERPTMRYQIGDITISKGQWKWSKEKGLRAYQNWLDFVAQGGSDASLKEYWERNRQKYLERTGFELEFVRTTETTAQYWVSPTDKVIMDTSLDYSSSGDTEVKNLIGGNYFSAPKPVRLIKKIIDMVCEKDCIVMDYFSGSGTTAQAVMQLNAEDGGNRKFILVQLPEECDSNGEAYNAGFKNICEIGKERIRQAGVRINASAGLMAQNLDTGFRVLKLDSSNMKDVYYKPDETSQQSIEDILSNVKEDRTPMDLLFQSMLETDALLSSKIEEKLIEGKKVYIVNDNDLICCFDDDIGDDVVKAIAQMKPLYAVFRDSSFKSDDTMVNAEQYFRTYAPDTQYRII